MAKLIGTDPNQVPSNADLGTAAFADKNDFISKRDIANNFRVQLSGSSRWGSVDKIFIYDTRLDSDGGAWRKRTQGTSWYNEPLNTRFRGSRKEFPQVAIIAIHEDTGTNQRVVIYDADDPGLPMWMVFESVTGNMWFFPSPLSYDASTAKLEDVHMLNGVLCGGTTPFGFKSVNFISEYSEFRELGYFRRIQIDISERGRTNGNFAVQPLPDLGSHGHLKTDSVRAIDMKVFDNAPIDERSGLPKPTIALALESNGGASVILPNDYVYDSSTSLNMADIAFAENGDLYFCRETSNEYIFAAKRADWEGGNGWGQTLATSASGDSHQFDLFTRSRELKTLKNNTLLARGSSSTLSLKEGISLYKIDTENYARSMGCLINTEVNTGWMPGTTTLCLADTKAGWHGEHGAEYSWTFSSDINGWTAGGNTNLTWTNNAIQLENVSAGASTATHPITLYAGRTYYVRAYYNFGNHYTANIYIRTPGGSDNLVLARSRVDSPSDGYYTGYYTATETGEHQLKLYGSTSAGGYTIQWDNIFVGEGLPNRAVDNTLGSSNWGGWKVNGSILATPVAPGADLVAYENFSANDYLEAQKDALNGSWHTAGTDDFCIGMWAKKYSNKLNVLFEMGVPGSSAGSNSFAAAFAADGTPYFQTHYSSSDYLRTTNSGRPLANDLWYHLVFIRTGGGIATYVNGELFHFVTAATPKDVTNVSANTVFWLGKELNGLYPFDGAITLFKFARTIPTNEQIREWYQEEKPLMQPNAKCLLSATNYALSIDADPYTNYWYAGGNKGIDVFNNLLRIDQISNATGMDGGPDTLAVRDGLIAED